MTNFDIPFYKNRERERDVFLLFFLRYILKDREREKIRFLKVIGISEVAGTKQNLRISLQILHGVDQHTFCKILSISQKQRTQMTYDFLPEKQISLEIQGLVIPHLKGPIRVSLCLKSQGQNSKFWVCYILQKSAILPK